MSDIQTKILAKLQAQGKLSSSDVATAATESAAEPEKPAGTNMESTDTVPVDEAQGNVFTDKIEERMAELSELMAGSVQNPIVDMLMRAASQFNKVTITPHDKDEFLKALISGKCMHSDIICYGGHLKIKLRSRTSAETGAIAAELARATRANELSRQAEYNEAALRYGLRFQLVSVNSVEYPPIEGDLNPKMTLVDGTPRATQAPWATECPLWFAKMPDALYNTLLEQLRIFEFKYNTMIAGAQDQNFWNPEASTAES